MKEKVHKTYLYGREKETKKDLGILVFSVHEAVERGFVGARSHCVLRPDKAGVFPILSLNNVRCFMSAQCWLKTNSHRVPCQERLCCSDPAPKLLRLLVLRA